MNKHTKTITYTNEAGTIPITSQVMEADLSQNIEVDIPANAVDHEIVVSVPDPLTLRACAFAVKKKGLQETSLQVGLITIKTNTITGADIIKITTTNGCAWGDGDDPVTNPKPINTAVTRLFVSNDGDAIAEFKGRVLFDSTPSTP